MAGMGKYPGIELLIMSVCLTSSFYSEPYKGLWFYSCGVIVKHSGTPQKQYSFKSFSYLFHYICHDRIIYLCITDDVSTSLFQDYNYLRQMCMTEEVLVYMLQHLITSITYMLVLCALYSWWNKSISVKTLDFFSYRTLNDHEPLASSTRLKNVSRPPTARGHRQPCLMPWTASSPVLWLHRW